MNFSMALRIWHWMGTVKCVYICVERMLEWPSSTCTMRVSTPASNNRVAKLCRKTWGVTSSSPAAVRACLNAIWTEHAEAWVLP
jgi:hypothetical protein